MAKTRSMTRSQNHDDGASSSGKRPKGYAPWSDLDHDLLFLVMMRLGVVDFFSFRGVCKSWRSLACENQNMFMASMPPMHISTSTNSYEKEWYLEDFEDRKIKTILPDFASRDNFFGLTCGYLIFFMKETRDFRLVNPITTKELYFPDFPDSPIDFPFGYQLGVPEDKAILVFSPSINGLVFVVLCKKEIWFSIAGKRAWNHVSHPFRSCDVYAFKGKIYTLSYYISYLAEHEDFFLCELRLNLEPKVTLLETKNSLCSEFFSPEKLLSLGENLYVIGWDQNVKVTFQELYFGEMKWVSHQTTDEFAFFRSDLNRSVAVKRESWADPPSHGRYVDTHIIGKIRIHYADMWYFPHECMNVDHIDE